jgi:hypothetical protein
VTRLLAFYSLLLIISLVAISVTPVYASSQKFCDGLTTPDEINAVDIGLNVRLEVDYLDNKVSNPMLTIIL